MAIGHISGSYYLRSMRKMGPHRVIGVLACHSANGNAPSLSRDRQQLDCGPAQAMGLRCSQW